MKSKKIITSAIVTLSMLSGVLFSFNKPVKSAQAIQHNNGYPYFELGETTYVKGSLNATFSNGIFLHDQLDMGVGVYIYISNQNLYNTTTTNAYPTYENTLIFVNVVFYDLHYNGANAFSFVLRDELGGALSTNEWQSIHNLTLLVSQYQSTDNFVVSYAYVYRLFGSGESLNVSRDTGITNVNNPHTKFNGGLPNNVTPNNLSQNIKFRTYGYTVSDIDDAYDNGYLNGINKGNSNAYSSGYEEGLKVNNSQLYDEAYNKGANESFMAGLQKWMVPAIITVILLGGATAYIQMKRKEN